jgi:hypothetical protein
MFKQEIVFNVSLVSMDVNVNTIVVYVKMNVVIYIPARVVVEMDIMSLHQVLKTSVKHVCPIVNIVKMEANVLFAIMVIICMDSMTEFTVSNVCKNCHVMTVKYKAVTIVKFLMAH